MNLTQPIHRLLDLALEQLAPLRCPGCDREHGTAGFCGACQVELGAPLTTSTALSDNPEGPRCPLRALAAYRPPLSTAIQRVKYEQRSDLVRPLADAWLNAHPEAGDVLADCLVPVPLHPRRLAARGFNQSALVAGQLSSRLAIPRAPRILHKVIETPSQASLGRERRRANLLHAFAADTARTRRGQRLILIDDVVTTGETARACVRALHSARLRVVEVWALACTPIESNP